MKSCRIAVEPIMQNIEVLVEPPAVDNLFFTYSRKTVTFFLPSSPTREAYDHGRRRPSGERPGRHRSLQGGGHAPPELSRHGR